ncbi:MAG TPA: abscisic acid-deficient protein Aba4 family protein [Vicinamibacterales bacterium]|nr:abscisic acid-deficient protein Aba4 family protein [Vicinamibacterales bacterium]
MDLERMFSVATMIAIAGWLMLAVVPRQPFTQIISAIVAPLLLAGLYLYLIAMHLQSADGGFGSLADVASCCWPAGFTISASICSSARGKSATRNAARSLTSWSSPACS